MFWKTYSPIFIVQAIFAFVYLGWPMLKTVLGWVGRKIEGSIPFDPEVEDTRPGPEARTGFKGKWREHSARFEERAYAHFGQSGSPPPNSPEPPPLTPRRAHLKTLGLTGEPDAKARRSAYRALAKKFHPDRFASSAHSDAERSRASLKMREINEAYDWLEANA